MLASSPAGDAKEPEAKGAGNRVVQNTVTPPSDLSAKERPANDPRAGLHALLRRPRLLGTGFLFLGLCACLALAAPHLHAWYHLGAARADLQAYHNPQAIRHLQVCVHQWPDNAEVRLLTARAARRAGAYDEAEQNLEKYRRIRGLDDAGSFEQLLLSAERDVDQVAAVCRRHVEHDHPDKPLILEALTRGYLRQYRLSEARFCLDLWLQDQPDNPQALSLKGQFHVDYEHAPDRAVESYRRAVQLDPEHEEARLGLVIVLLQTKTFSEAVKHLEYLRKCQPDNLRVQVGLADCLHALGEREEAERLVDGALARQADYAPALAMRGELDLEDGRYEEAEARLRQAVARAPGDHQAQYNLILCLHHNSKVEEAKAREQELRQWEDDLNRFNEIVTKEMPKRTDDAALHFTLGQLLLRSGHQEEGLRWLHSALRLDPQYAPARQALKDYYDKATSNPPQPRP